MRKHNVKKLIKKDLKTIAKISCFSTSSSSIIYHPAVPRKNNKNDK